MANKSASFNKVIGTTGYGYAVRIRGYLEETATDIAENNSTVKRQLWAIIDGGTASDYNTVVKGNGSILHNGYLNVTTTATYFINDSITVAHNTDGTGSYTLSGSMSMSYLGYSGSGSCTLTLTTLPRTSSVSVANSSRLAGQSQTINVSRATASFTHNLYYRINGSGSWTTIATGVATSYAWTIPLSLITTVANKSATINILCETYSGSTYIGGAQTSFTLTPYSASTISETSGSTIGSAMAITIARNNSAFTHTVTYAFGDESGTIATGAGASANWSTIPKTLANQIPNSLNGSGYLYVTTYYGDLQIGSTQPKSITLYIPDTEEFYPTFESVTSELVNEGMPSDWNVYARTLSKVKLTINGAVGAYGSTIASFSIVGAGYTGTTNPYTTGLLNDEGEQTFTAKITDTRGRSAEKNITIDVVAYNSPSVTYSAVRCDADGNVDLQGTYLKVDVNYTFSEVNGLNSASVIVSCNGATEEFTKNGDSKTLDANCLISKMYTVSAIVSDEVRSMPPITIVILPATVLWAGRGDNRALAVGGYPTRIDAFQSWWPMYDHLDRLIEIGAMGFYITHDSSSLTIGNYDDWVEAGMPLWPTE